MQENTTEPCQNVDNGANGRRSVFKAWWQASRPPFYIATLIPLCLAFIASVKDTGQWNWLVFTGAVLISLALHLSTNLANDLFDHLAGTDSQETLGGSRVLQEGTITVKQLKIAVAALNAAAVALGLLGVAVTGLWGLLPIVVFAALSGLFYVAPPVKYGYRALGEAMVFLNMGLVMILGCYYGLTGTFSRELAAISIPVGLMVAGILYYQSLPEIETDKEAGKHTLANVLGPVKAVFLFKLWWPVVWLLMLTLWLTGVVAWPVLLGVALGVSLHARACMVITRLWSDWVKLDRYGYLVRLMYLSSGLALIFGLVYA